MRQNVNIRLALPFASSDKCKNSLKREWIKWIALPLIACFVAMRLFPRKDLVQQFRKGNLNPQQFPWIFHRRQIKLLNESETYGKLGQWYWYWLTYCWCIVPPLLECTNLKKTWNITLWPISWSWNEMHPGYGRAMCTKDIGMMVSSSWPSRPKSGQPKSFYIFLKQIHAAALGVFLLKTIYYHHVWRFMEPLVVPEILPK